MAEPQTETTQADVHALFKAQLEAQEAEAPGADIDDDAQIGENEAEDEHTPPVEADEAPDEQDFTEDDAEPGEDQKTDNLEPIIQPPSGMTAEQQAQFARLDQGAQEFLVNQEAHRRVKLTAETERLATERKTLEAQTAEVAQQRQQYAQFLEGVASRGPKPPPAALAQEDPDAYAVQRAQYEEARDLNDAAAKELTRVQAEQTAEMERAQKAHEVHVRAELPSIIPEMADTKKAEPHRREMTAIALANGIPKEALAKANPGEWKLLDLAVKGLKAEQAGRTKGRKAQKGQRPGASRRPGDKRQSAKARVSQAAQKSVETNDLSHIFKARLEAEGK